MFTPNLYQTDKTWEKKHELLKVRLEFEVSHMVLLNFIFFSIFNSSMLFSADWSSELENKSIVVGNGSKEQQTIESIYSKVLMTQSGLSICLLMQGEPILFTKLLGVSDEMAQNISKLCLKKALSLWGSEIEKHSFININAKLIMLSRPSKRYLIVPDSIKFPYDSWTDTRNTTLISEDSFKSTKLHQILIHELQMAFDSKFRLNRDFIGEIEDGWTVVSKSLFKPFVDKDLRTQFQLIQESPLKNIFSVIRAFNFEVAVLSELDSLDASPFKANVMNRNDCFEFVEIFISKYYFSRSDVTTIKQAWQRIKNSHIEFRYTYRGINDISFCQFMAMPSFAITNEQTEGPRPRIRPSADWVNEYQYLNIKHPF